MSKRRIAVVVQRYGAEVNGGAELEARWVAEHLTPEAEIHAITTCAIDYATWENEYPPGESLLNGVLVHRFPVDEVRQWDAAQRYTGHLLLRDHTLFEEITWIKQQGPYSTPLLNFIQESHSYFDAYIFFTYLYATTYFGLPLVSEKALLVPTAHDEPFLYMPAYRPIFHLPQAIVYNTKPEQALVNHVMGNSYIPSVIAAIGIDVPSQPDATAFREKFDIAEPFLLYMGRLHPGKNVPELINYFLQFRAVEKERPLKLVLAGKSHIQIPDHPDIIPLGFISEEDKFNAIKAASIVVMPSLYESLSIIVLEAWLMGRPVLVNGRCDVLRYQCRRSNGGLYYHNFIEFRTALTYLLQTPELQTKLGEQGRTFANSNYQWPTVVGAYRQILKKVTHSP